MLSHTFFLCNKNKELARYESLVEQINQNQITNYSFFSHIWGDEVTPEIRKLYCKSDFSMKFHHRNMIDHPLLNTEISLFLNHIECLRHIRCSYTNGYFAIFESDAIFYNDYNNKITIRSNCPKNADVNICQTTESITTTTTAAAATTTTT